MKTTLSLIAFATGLALAACSAPQPSAESATTTGADRATAPAAPAVATAPAATPAATPDVAATPVPASAPSATDAAPAGKDSMTSSGTQAGWYSAGTFRACGSSTGLKIDNTADIERQIKAGGMSAGEPVYVKLEGMPMAGDTYMLTRVVQVGSKTPVRDCPMSGTTTQIGG